MGSLTDTLKTAPTLEFMFNLSAEERLTILECAHRHLWNMICDVMPHDYNLDISHEELKTLFDKFDKFMNEKK
jgi:hypothetical protein